MRLILSHIKRTELFKTHVNTDKKTLCSCYHVQLSVGSLLLRQLSVLCSVLDVFFLLLPGLLLPLGVLEVLLHVLLLVMIWSLC